MTVGERDASGPDDEPGTTDADPADDADERPAAATAPADRNGDGTEHLGDRVVDDDDDPTFDPDEPWLGTPVAAATPVEPVPNRGPQTGAATNVYRSRDERNRSVYRRANPWYRRLARGLIAICLLSGAALGVYVGARALQDWLDRDQIPAAGAEVPEFSRTSFLITSTAASVPLEGTLTLDVDTGAWEFVGLAGSPNATDNLTSPDGVEVFAQTQNGLWAPVDGGDPVVQSVDTAISYLRDDATADAILTNRLRRGYIDLVDQVDEGEGDDVRTRYELDLDLEAFADAFPLQWQDFQDTALPGAAEVNNHRVTLWLDDEEVLVGVSDPTTGWSWERLTYSDDGFEALDPPANQVVDPITEAQIASVQCTVTGVSWDTALATCDAALESGRALAVQAGLADTVASPGADLAVATVCSTLQGDESREYDEDGYLILAGLLVDTGVCPGNTALVVRAG